MPEIVKQTNKPLDPKRIENPIDRIAPVGMIDSEGLRMSLYGVPKTGKTRIISTFPKPVLIIGTEDGTRSIRGVKNVDFVLLANTKEIAPLVDYAISKNYKTIALDTITQLQKMVLSEMLGLDEIPIQHMRGVLKNVDNQEYSHITKKALHLLLKFPGNVVYSAHQKDHTKEGMKKLDTDLITPSFGSDISTGVANWLNGTCDYVCQTFIREEKVIDNSSGVDIEVSSGKREYCLRVGAHPVYMTGFRVPLGSNLPSIIINPTYEKIKLVITGQAKGDVIT